MSRVACKVDKITCCRVEVRRQEAQAMSSNGKADWVSQGERKQMMWLEGVPVATIKKNDRTETDVVLHWVDGDTGSGFSSIQLECLGYV